VGPRDDLDAETRRNISAPAGDRNPEVQSVYSPSVVRRNIIQYIDAYFNPLIPNGNTNMKANSVPS
jgi:hypothetical protein